MYFGVDGNRQALTHNLGQNRLHTREHDLAAKIPADIGAGSVAAAMPAGGITVKTHYRFR